MGSLNACAFVRNGLVMVWTFVLAGATTVLQAQSNWTTYGGGDWNQRWSSLDQINTRNVGTLVPRMVLQTGTKPGSFENTPIVDGDVMYITTPYNDAVFAYDLAKKKELWRFGY
jgi:glucose dehydrogenase